MKERARYQDGVPVNLPAAASDALEWLRLWQRGPVPPLDAENRARLDRCTAALEKQLAPHLPAANEECGCPECRAALEGEA